MHVYAIVIYMKSIIKTMISILLLVSTAFAGNVTAPPTMMPNFPMLAGPNVMIMWIPVPGAVNYRVYMNGKPVGEAPAPPLTIPAPIDEGVYKYVITGVDAAGEEGPKSKPSELTIIKIMPPTNIRGQMLGDPRVLNLRWDPAKNAAIYDIYRSDRKDGPYKLIASVTETRYVDSDITEDYKSRGKTVYYKIVSKDKFNNPSPDNVPMPEPPPKPRVKKPVPKPTTQKPAHIPKKRPVVSFRKGRRGLAVQRTKQVLFAKPTGGGSDLQSNFDAAFLSDGISLVCVDTFSKKVTVINEYGDEIREIGEAGDKPDQYKEPIRLAVDKNDDIYIIDRKKPKIFVYDSYGDFKSAIDIHTVYEKDVLDQIEHINEPVMPRLSAIFLNRDWVYAYDMMTGTIQIYNKSNGKFAGYFKNIMTNKIVHYMGISKMLPGDNDKLYLARPLARIINVVSIDTGEDIYDMGISRTFIGAFAAINGMCFDKNGNLVVSDGTMHSVQVFNKDDGGYMYHIGDEKAVPDKKAKEQRPEVNLDFPGPVGLDNQGRLWIYLGKDHGFTVREYIDGEPWDATVDKPEL
jgi:hypothetical protein